MAKPKRMSEIFTSSSDKNASTALPTTTPPYSSEGPTLPIVGIAKKSNVQQVDAKTSKKRKAQDQSSNTVTTNSPPTVHPSLYTPWILLPVELLKLLESQTRLRGTQNVIPIVFTKNQNVKTGINRLKMLLGVSPNTASTIETRDAMNHKDLVIAISAQGDGTTKLVGIVDMTRRIVASGNSDEKAGKEIETWLMYTVLTSIKAERRAKNKTKEVEDTQETQEEEAFEPMEIDKQEDTDKNVEMRKVPVLTVWMTKKRIPEFRDAFGEQSFQVQRHEDLD
ncbi:hypothetical protein P153DRAFT_387698 [Dothidotthia symphoricarpi CBS 119687]|uniref:DNA/RNA-binding protein Alba-like domain-containing protein n=1 Tax=Dothidotthia symphoricarpi CBS 119687 TaxID=1392245 RepID=A0A6A6A5Q6_9PLEO|nr:uncharacterized protein P153DRAFT_387698 [Dothidotthia symphoricarpi CBS 119687]KAF2127150.1 hypothetical protein P153DRAFT_387698 [Dothidotthia symphoricarpi CBS 119687]